MKWRENKMKLRHETRWKRNCFSLNSRVIGYLRLIYEITIHSAKNFLLYFLVNAYWSQMLSSLRDLSLCWRSQEYIQGLDPSPLSCTSCRWPRAHSKVPCKSTLGGQESKTEDQDWCPRLESSEGGWKSAARSQRIRTKNSKTKPKTNERSQHPGIQSCVLERRSESNSIFRGYEDQTQQQRNWKEPCGSKMMASSYFMARHLLHCWTSWKWTILFLCTELY